ncbi:polysaccharide deacetylase family protein [Levilactobacillus zymae]|uniref:Polysaccharide deacetylase family protein n=1 Tax=Levilactobacillus zymae TaxID=267363 RepID=A0A1Y6JU52_9LACO|nr:polysaccharide deacetylase family protein [Levilactobacillus zymae]SMS13458.1 Polysaccharide deacetylase family protein [Levilactobacillus zymae]
MTRRLRRGLLVLLFLALILGFGWTYQHKAAKQQATKESYALPARYEKMSNGIMVFCYHRILGDNWTTRIIRGLSTNSQLHEFNVPADQFTAQMKYLHDHHVKVISAETMVKMVRNDQPIHGKYAVLSFDDIDRTVIDHAVPVMNRYKFPFTTFIITGNTGRYREGTQLATWSQIRAAEKASQGRMTLGLHTHNLHYLNSHMEPIFMQPHYTGKFERDFAVSKQELKAHTGVTGNSFAFPYGAGTDAIDAFLARQRLTWVATLDSGIVTDNTDLNATPRVIINHESWPSIQKWFTTK